MEADAFSFTELFSVQFYKFLGSFNSQNLTEMIDVNPCRLVIPNGGEFLVLFFLEPLY